MSRMWTARRRLLVVAAVCGLCTGGVWVWSQDVSAADQAGSSAADGMVHPSDFTEDFSLYEVDLSPTGRNPFFILEPGYRLVFGNEDAQLFITVLNRTKRIKGVTTRVVEEREFEGGRLVEVSLNYFAISRTNNSVFYFGEDVDIFDEDGNIISHEGAWLAGVNGAKEGLMMPGIALLGAKYAQEIAPEVAMDRAEIVAVDQMRQVPAGLFEHVIETRETTPLEPGAKDSKWYAAGVGLIQDADLVLLEFGFVK